MKVSQIFIFLTCNTNTERYGWGTVVATLVGASRLFLLSTSSRRPVGTTQPSVQWVPRFWVKRPKLPSVARVKNEWSCILAPRTRLSGLEGGKTSSLPLSLPEFITSWSRMLLHNVTHPFLSLLPSHCSCNMAVVSNYVRRPQIVAAKHERCRNFCILCRRRKIMWNSRHIFQHITARGFRKKGTLVNLITVQQDATVFGLLHFCRQLYKFRVLTPIIRSWYRL